MVKVSTLVSYKLNKFTLSYFSPLHLSFSHKIPSKVVAGPCAQLQRRVHPKHTQINSNKNKEPYTLSCLLHILAHKRPFPCSVSTHQKPIIQLSTCSCLRLSMSFVLFENVYFHRYSENRIRTLTHVCSNLITTSHIKLFSEEYG